MIYKKVNKTSSQTKKAYRIVKKCSAGLDGPAEIDNPISGEMTEGSNQDLIAKVFRFLP